MKFANFVYFCIYYARKSAITFRNLKLHNFFRGAYNTPNSNVCHKGESCLACMKCDFQGSLILFVFWVFFTLCFLGVGVRVGGSQRKIRSLTNTRHGLISECRLSDCCF